MTELQNKGEGVEGGETRIRFFFLFSKAGPNFCKIRRFNGSLRFICRYGISRESDRLRYPFPVQPVEPAGPVLITMISRKKSVHSAAQALLSIWQKKGCSKLYSFSYKQYEDRSQLPFQFPILSTKWIQDAPNGFKMRGGQSSLVQSSRLGTSLTFDIMQRE